MENEEKNIVEGVVENSAPSSGVPVKKERENMRMFVFGFLGLIGAVVLILALVGVYRVYAKTATDQFTYTVANILNLPAFKMGDKSVLYTAYVDDLRALQTLRAYSKANSDTDPTYATITDDQINDQVLFRLFDNVMVQTAAKSYGVSVSDSDMANSKTTVLNNFESNAAAEKAIKERFGWNLDTYMSKVVYPYNLKDNLNTALIADQTIQKPTYDKAMSVFKLLQSGSDFSTLAKQYGSDATASVGGDLGWFGKGVMVKEFEDAAFALKKGELAGKLVQTQYGYHIIKVTDIKTAKNSAGVDETQVRASHILFPYIDVNTYLDGLVRQAKIHLYINVNNPLDELLQATSTTSNSASNSNATTTATQGATSSSTSQ